MAVGTLEAKRGSEAEKASLNRIVWSTTKTATRIVMTPNIGNEQPLLLNYVGAYKE